MPLKSLAYTDDEIAQHKAEQAKYSPMPSEYVGPKFPWGLQLSFENSSLEKMGKSVADFKPGTDVPFEGTLRITGISMNENEDGTKSQCVSAVLSAINTDETRTDADRSKAIYDSGS